MLTYLGHIAGTYLMTREFAEATHRKNSTIQGFRQASGQNAQACTYIFFVARIPPGTQ